MENEPVIVLVHPDVGRYIFSLNYPPLGLGYLAAMLSRGRFKVKIIDLSIRNIKFEVLKGFFKKHQPLFVGITALSPYYSRMKQISTMIRDTLPELPIVLGGVHASSLPEQALKECKVNIVAIGEADETILEIANHFRFGEPRLEDIKGIMYRDGETVIKTPERDFIKNLDELPFPKWDLINPKWYPNQPAGFIIKHAQMTQVISSRGCPFSCHYCASCNFWRRRIRFRSPKNVVDEIEYLHYHFGIREIHFWDDNLTLKRAHIVGICREIIARGLNHIAFCTPNGVRFDTLDATVLKWMKAAGFYYLTFSIESGSQSLLLKNDKKTSLLKIARNVYLAKKIGFMIKAFFILVLPGETVDFMKKTITLAKSLPLDNAAFFLAKPLPGSRILRNFSMRKRSNLSIGMNSITMQKGMHYPIYRRTGSSKSNYTPQGNSS